MRLNASLLKLMARGSLVGLVSLGTGCPDTSQQAPPASPTTGTDPSLGTDPGQAPGPVGTDPGQAPGLDPGQEPLTDSDQPPADPGQASPVPRATPSAAPACGGVHEDFNTNCPECDFCPPCGRG